MKKFLTIVMAVLMLASAVPLVGLAAADNAAVTSGPYVLYEQNFNNLTGSGQSLLNLLGWESSTAVSDSMLSIVGGRLQIDTVSSSSAVSYLTFLDDDLLAVARNGDFTISYKIKYDNATSVMSNAVGVVYNYNRKTGNTVSETTGEVYGYGAIARNGSAALNIKYPLYGSSCSTQLGKSVTVPTNANDMKSYDTTVTIKYSANNGVTLTASNNGTSKSISISGTESNGVWGDFVARNNDATAIALRVEKAKVVIDDIKITSDSLGTITEGKAVPELVITELSASGSVSWAEYIELHNASPKRIYLKDYAIARSYGYGHGDVNIATGAYGNPDTSKPMGASGFITYTTPFSKTYNEFVYFSDLIGATITTGEYARSADHIASLAKTQYVVGSASNKIKYTEKWNTQYNKDTFYLEPGETMLLFPMLLDTNYPEGAFRFGVNGGVNDQKADIVKGSFRDIYKDHGLSKDTKILAMGNGITTGNSKGFNCADNTSARYYICKATSSKSTVVTDLSKVVSYVDYETAIVTGNPRLNLDPSSGDFGKAGEHRSGYSAVYVYGVDASADYRQGTQYLYDNQIKRNTTVAHVGKQAGFQQVIFDTMRTYGAGCADTLMITEIVPKTLNLAGDEKSAFTAMEITNAGNAPIDLYRYSLVRTGLDYNGVKGFEYATYMQPGNPVTRTEFNGGYYYFIGSHVANPETCLVQPGETVVIWFITTDTYSSYGSDNDFSTEYFRRYWAENGSGELATKNQDGSYTIRVIAVDGVTSDLYNKGNSERVFELNPDCSATYGIATTSRGVKQGAVPGADILSLACFSLPAWTFDLRFEELANADGYRAAGNVMNRSGLGVNESIRFVAGLTANSRLSAMKKTVKVTFHNWDTTLGIWKYVLKDGETAESFLQGTDVRTKLVMRNNSFSYKADLGNLEGEEAAAGKSAYFIKGSNNQANYFNAAKVYVNAVEGAAINIYSKGQLRFAAGVRRDVYQALRSNYGSGVKIGTLVMKTDDIATLDVVTKETLDAAGVEYTTYTPEICYTDDRWCVLSVTHRVSEEDYYTSYTAVTYLEVTLKDNTKQIFWSDTRANGAISDIVAAALADTSDVATDKYCYDVEGVYSPYNENVRQTLNDYFGM